MEFTQSFPACYGIARPSPSGKFVASIAQPFHQANTTHLIVQETGNGTLWRRFPITAWQTINTPNNHNNNNNANPRFDLTWAPNSELLSLTCPAKAQILIFAVNGNTDQPLTIIKENNKLGIERVNWLADSLHVLVWLRHRVGIRIWSITERWPKATVTDPKFIQKGCCFSSDGKWMAVLLRRKQRDILTMFNCQQNNWQKPVWSSPAPDTTNLDDISFAPLFDHTTDSYPPILAWEAPAWSNRLFIFHGSACRVISQAATDSLQSFGYDRLIWCPTGWMAALIQDNQSFKLWNAIANRLGETLTVGPTFIKPEETVIFREKISKDLGSTGVITEKSIYEPSFNFTLLKTNCTGKKEGSNPLELYFSPDSAYIAIYTLEYPTCVWILNVSEMAIVAVLHQVHQIRSLVWHDQSPILMILTAGHAGIFVWQPNGCLCVPQPSVPDARHLMWLRRRETLLITGGSTFSLATPDWATY